MTRRSNFGIYIRGDQRFNGWMYVPDTHPIIQSGGATIYTTAGAPAAGNSNFINSMDPINDIATDNVGAGRFTKLYETYTLFYHWRYWRRCC